MSTLEARREALLKTSPYRARARRGIALLNRRSPGWRTTFRTEGLDIGSECECALARVYGTYREGCSELRLNDVAAIDHGFLYEAHNDDTDMVAAEVDRLNAAWQIELAEI